MNNWLKKYADPVCPLFGIIPLLACFLLNMLVYSGTMILCADRHHYDLTTVFDQSVPFRTGWVYIYLGCFLFWVVNYIMVARIHRDDKNAFYRFVTADMMSRLVCAVFFIGFPTTNVRPAITGTGIADRLLAFVYTIDQPTNLFPSIHCLVSWLCFVGIRSSKKVPLWYKMFSCIFALLVVASTQFTKQHYIADAIAGLFLAEILYLLNQRTRIYVPVKNAFEKLNHKLSID
jgi:membrane-associated phospholipid phosphatase